MKVEKIINIKQKSQFHQCVQAINFFHLDSLHLLDGNEKGLAYISYLMPQNHEKNLYFVEKIKIVYFIES